MEFSVPDQSKVTYNPPKKFELNLKKFQYEQTGIKLKDPPKVEVQAKGSLEEIYARNAVEKDRTVSVAHHRLQWNVPKDEINLQKSSKPTEIA